MVNAGLAASGATPPAIPATGDVWDGSIEQPTKIVQKDGVNYYEIAKCSQLAYVAQTGGDWLGRNYLLANNLILNNITFRWDSNANLETNTKKLKRWTPIGRSETDSFTGTFDGANYTISGVFFDGASDYSGLVGCVGIGGIVENVTVVNSHFEAQRYAGGIAGCSFGTIKNCCFCGVINAGYDSPFWSYFGGITGESYGKSGHKAFVTNCINYGTIVGNDEFVGGVVGGSHFSSDVNHCENYGRVIGNTYVGGIIGGASSSYPVTMSINYGDITGNSHIGGIVGYAYSSFDTNNCANYGQIVGNGDFVGGIVGFNSRDSSNCINGFCANYGMVSGENGVGGIAGYGSRVSNSYNLGSVTGKNNVGGLVGQAASLIISYCYNVGVIKGTSYSTGTIIGSDGAIWGKDTITSCYYLQTGDLYGCGSVDSASMEPDGFFSCLDTDLKKQSTFAGWDFWETWRINENVNSGFPFLAWEYLGDFSPLTGITLSEDALILSAGDCAFLSAMPVPSDADINYLYWSSKDREIADVNSSGKVTAIEEGTTEIVAACGEFIATCTVTVTARQAEEYRLGELIVRDANGAALTAIPRGNFLVTIPITKLASGGNAMVMLASYSASGQFKGLLYVGVEDVPVGATIKVTLPVDNTKGDIALLKAFTIASFPNPVPVGAAVSFPDNVQ